VTLRTLGTAGHIDHGKTALVEALTGTNTDRLPEERRRGISIALGYARLGLGDGHALSVVDVPGHERFVRTMVAGATGIDLALLCIACDDGVMPQTREHLAILDLLGVRRGVVALTKRDLVDEEGAELAAADAAELLAGSGLEGAPMVEVSVRDGRGVEELRALLAGLARAERTPRGRRARLPIDRVFSLRGIGTVVTGTLWSGSLAVGDRVAIRPGGAVGRIRSLQQHDEHADEVTGGGRTAVSLVGIERGDIPRGAMLVSGAAPPASYRLDVALHCVAREVRHSEHVEVLHGTAGVGARVVLIGAERLGPGEDGFAQLRLEEPLTAVRGDRAVVRSLAPPDTVAGAVILDPAPPRHAALTERLELLASGGPEAILLDEARRPVEVADLVARGLLEPEDAEAAAASLLATGRVVDLAGHLLERSVYDATAAASRKRLTERAQATPLAPGVALGELVADAPWRDALLDRMEADGVLGRSGGEAVLPGAAATSSAAGAAADEVVAALDAVPFSPPRIEEVLPGLGLDDAAGRALVALLEREGRVVRLPDGLAVGRTAYETAVQFVRRRCEERGAVTLAELRDATGTSRKWAQALLERMDADGITRRVGDERVLRRRR
jgi:selenocysteine-specific elongation factor